MSSVHSFVVDHRLGTICAQCNRGPNADCHGGTEIEGGKKFDTGKAPLSLLPSAALTGIAEVLAFGARKYDPWNWKGGFAWSRLASAALRHLFAWLAGEDKDPESGLSHLAHCSCCLIFLLDFEVNHLGQDDRYKPPTSVS